MIFLAHLLRNLFYIYALKQPFDIARYSSSDCRSRDRTGFGL